MIGKTISHYKILEKLGEGGMGEVYLAQDTKLKRKVVLKFLHLHLTTDNKILQRFEREAQAAAALNHPNIVTIYEINQHDGKTFIAMEYVEGDTLRDRIGQGEATSPLQIDDIIHIATQICNGLDTAHQAGITHRDIKPENILIDKSGRVKIADFGLARMKGTSKLTKDTTTLGTFRYMSPEQFQNKEVDHRTDIWSFGVVLFEMLTGQLPFQGEYEAAVMYSVLNEKAQSVRKFRKDVPNHLENMIYKCFEKNPDSRYPNINKVLEDLKKPVEISAAKKDKESIAVLPFENMSTDAEQEYFCDGMTEEIINALTHIENLKVIARTSAFMFKGKHEDIREIGRKLDVEHLLEGSVRKAGNKLRITAQLIKVDDGSHLWSEKYDREMEDIFDIQDEISLAIVDNLKVKLLGEEREALLKHSTTNEYAYNLYLQGRFNWNKLTVNDLENAVNCFNKAIESDPNFALAYFGLADTYWMLHQLVPLRADDAFPKTKGAALKALEIDNTLAEAYAMVGAVLYMYEWKWSEAEEYFKKAYSLNPRSGPVKMYYSSFLQYTDRKLEAIQMMEETLETDPYSLIFNSNVAIRLYIAERYNDTIKKCEDLLRMEPNFWPAYQFIGRSYICIEMYDKAEQALMKANELLGGVPETLPLLGYVYAKQGKKSEAKKIISILDKESKTTYIPVFYYAYVYKGLGEIDKTFEYLQKAIDEHDPRVAWWIRYIPFKNLRNDRRYADMIRKLGMEFLEQELMEQLPLEKTNPSIIVLPFENMSPDPDQEYFSDGLTEEIITDLSHVHDLLVISRSSAMTFKGKKKKIKEIARDVNVQYVLEGSVRKAGKNLRITAQLIDAATDVHLWAEKYSGTLDDVFDIQEKVSRSIVEALKLKLSSEERGKIDQHPISNVYAYECYLKARQEIRQFSEDKLKNAIQHLQQGVKIVGENPVLISGIGYVYWQYANLNIDYEVNSLKAQEYAEKALTLDPDSVQAHLVLGLIHILYRGKMKEALYHLKHGYETDPNDSDILFWLGYLYVFPLGKPSEAKRYIDRAQEIDPLNPSGFWGSLNLHFFSGDFHSVYENANETLQSTPENPNVIWGYALALAYTDRCVELNRFVQQNISSPPSNVLFRSCLLIKSALAGEKEQFDQLTTPDFLTQARNDHWSSLLLTITYAMLKEKEKALNWLENAVNRGFINYPYLNEHDPFLRIIRGEERFKKIMKRVKKEWENFEV